MKIGVLTALFGGMSLKKVLDYACKLELDAVEIGTGNYPGSPHINMPAPAYVVLPFIIFLVIIGLAFTPPIPAP